jgi:predicted alpha-1,2-mannosidase
MNPNPFRGRCAGCADAGKARTAAGALALALWLAAGALHAENVDLVDPAIGTQNGGNTIIGPSLPFGMIKPGPDTGANDQNSGYAPGQDINGFSQTHVSGTGGGAKYGNILIQPTVGVLAIDDIGSPPEHEETRLCYYAVTLKRYGVRAEVTTAARAALYRFSFPLGGPAHVLFDAGHCLNSGVAYGEGQMVTASSVQVLSPSEVAGSSTLVGGWNEQTRPFTVFFYAVTDSPAAGFGTWNRQDQQPLHPGGKLEAGGQILTGAWLDFAPGKVVRVKIGISFVSVAQARANTRDIGGFDFRGTLAAGVDAWRKALSTIQIAGGTPAQRTLFYTSLYHAMLMPVDRTGENPLWKSPEPSYDDFYTLWDTFRVSNPLLTLLAEDRESGIVRALVDIEKHDGFMPDGRSGNANGRTQGGSNADIVVADAYVKHLPGVNWEDAYASAVRDAEVPPVDPMKEGRGGLGDWRRLGYCSIEGVDRPASKTMEYAYDDFAVAELAQGLGRPAQAAKYLKRAGQWVNLWDRDFTDAGFSGFIRSRHANGAWKDPFKASEGCSWYGDTFYEGNSWTYSFFVPQDVAGLVARTGGAAAFVARLDHLFETPGLCDVGDEPFFLTPYLYIWAGRHDRTAERVHQLLAKNFAAAPGGLPGNDDSGAMAAWYAFGAIGIFPNAGQDYYLIGTPTFDTVRLRLANGRTFTIRAENLSGTNIYVASALLNGRPFERAWIRHGDLMAGGSLVLHMGDRPTPWPAGPVPPSPLSDATAPR